MGNCKPQSRLKQSKTAKFITEAPQHFVRPHKDYKLRNDTIAKKLTFDNAPLANNDFLFQKFHHDHSKPDEINLQWQVCESELIGSDLCVKIINEVPVKVWVILGGKETKTVTQLYIEISGYTFCECHEIGSINSVDLPLTQIFKLPKFCSDDKIRIILESTSIPSCSFSVISTFNRMPFKMVKQQMQWNNLLFQLENIFNQSQQPANKNNDEMNECVICHLEAASSILLPCKHMCIGVSCLKDFKKMFTVCPLCKKQFDDIVVYKECKN